MHLDYWLLSLRNASSTISPEQCMRAQVYPSVSVSTHLYFISFIPLFSFLSSLSPSAFPSSHLITILITVKSDWISSSLPLLHTVWISLSPIQSLKLIFQSLPPPPVSFCCFISLCPLCKSNIFGSVLSVEPVCVCVVSDGQVHEQVTSLKLTSYSRSPVVIATSHTFTPPFLVLSLSLSLTHTDTHAD